MNIEPVANNDRCGKCGVRHGGNDHLCPVHGAVTGDCCATPCDPEQFARVTTYFTNGNLQLSSCGIYPVDEMLPESTEVAKKSHQTLRQFVRFVERNGIMANQQKLLPASRYPEFEHIAR